MIDRDSKTLVIKKQTESSQLEHTEIPIDESGNFSYDLHYDHVEAYELIFKEELERGAWRPIQFFPDNDTIRFTLYPSQMADSNKITGSELSLKEVKLNQEIMRP